MTETNSPSENSLLDIEDPIFDIDWADISEVILEDQAADSRKSTDLVKSSESEKRFASLSERELEKLLEDKHSSKTKKSTNWCVSTFKGNNLKSSLN